MKHNEIKELIRMNDTPQGDGNLKDILNLKALLHAFIRMNDTPQGDGNPVLEKTSIKSIFSR